VLFRSALEPLEQELPRRPSPVDHTYNDLAPPAAVLRQDRGNRPDERENVSPEVDTAPLPELELDATGPVPSQVPTTKMEHPASMGWGEPVETLNRPPSGAHVVQAPPATGSVLFWLVVLGLAIGVGAGLALATVGALGVIAWFLVN
jgi:hypothetical protein